MAGITNTKSRVTLAVAVVLLLTGVAFQLVRTRNASEGDTQSERLRDYFVDKVPVRISGWESQDLPLGSTELLKGQVASILNYDAFVYRRFTKGARRFEVYAAYWRPDRMPVSRVVSHTPDRCWTENGWTCEQMTFNRRWQLPGGGQSIPAQERVFRSPGGTPEHVAFWHLVDGRWFDFGERFTAFTDPRMWLRNTLAYAASGSSEQCFVRLTSDRPFADFADDPGWQELIAALGRLGLLERRS